MSAERAPVHDEAHAARRHTPIWVAVAVAWWVLMLVVWFLVAFGAHS